MANAALNPLVNSVASVLFSAPARSRKIGGPARNVQKQQPAKREQPQQQPQQPQKRPPTKTKRAFSPDDNDDEIQQPIVDAFSIAADGGQRDRPAVIVTPILYGYVAPANTLLVDVPVQVTELPNKTIQISPATGMNVDDVKLGTGLTGTDADLLQPFALDFTNVTDAPSTLAGFNGLYLVTKYNSATNTWTLGLITGRCKNDEDAPRIGSRIWIELGATHGVYEILSFKTSTTNFSLSTTLSKGIIFGYKQHQAAAGTLYRFYSSPDTMDSGNGSGSDTDDDSSSDEEN